MPNRANTVRRRPVQALNFRQKGPPGLKGQRLRMAVGIALSRFTSGDNAGGISKLKEAIGHYDADEA